MRNYLMRCPHGSSQIADDDEEEGGEGGDKPKKKKKKDNLFSKKTKSDPNAPPLDRIPLPPLRDSDKVSLKHCPGEKRGRKFAGVSMKSSISKIIENVVQTCFNLNPPDVSFIKTNFKNLKFSVFIRVRY